MGKPTLTSIEKHSREWWACNQNIDTLEGGSLLFFTILLNLNGYAVHSSNCSPVKSAVCFFNSTFKPLSHLSCTEWHNFNKCLLIKTRALTKQTCRPSVNLLLGRRRRRWPNSKLTLGPRLVFAGYDYF